MWLLAQRRQAEYRAAIIVIAAFGKAYALLSKDAWFVEQESERLARMKQLGEE